MAGRRLCPCSCSLLLRPAVVCEGLLGHLHFRGAPKPDDRRALEQLGELIDRTLGEVGSRSGPAGRRGAETIEDSRTLSRGLRLALRLLHELGGHVHLLRLRDETAELARVHRAAPLEQRAQLRLDARRLPRADEEAFRLGNEGRGDLEVSGARDKQVHVRQAVGLGGHGVSTLDHVRAKGRGHLVALAQAPELGECRLDLWLAVEADLEREREHFLEAGDVGLSGRSLDVHALKELRTHGLLALRL
mmetsp:Transcript_11824/g.35053  ORF Transcript_11824/g.35053 Transcript_11824/m.35053 type:complete len:247 (-) Transcript_11824:534-1274(-)